MKIYHNPRCSKSRLGKAYLEEKGLDFEVVEYLKNPISESELADLLMKLNMKPQELLRKNEAVYKSEFKGLNFTDEEWIKVMVENPKLIERPIVVNGNRAVVARPTEKIDEIV